MAINCQAAKETAQYYLVPSLKKANVFKGQFAVAATFLALSVIALKRTVASSFANRSCKAVLVLATAYLLAIGIRAGLQLRKAKGDDHTTIQPLNSTPVGTNSTSSSSSSSTSVTG